MGNFFTRKFESRIIIQGLDAAGKTSLLYRLKLGEIVTTIPTIGFNVETLEVGGISITCWDVGGRDKIRPLYRHYYQDASGFVYVIDSNDKERFDEALDELVRNILLDEMAKDTVIMVLVNKQDLPSAMSVSEVESALKKKYTFTEDSGHTVFVMPCSAVIGDGIGVAFSHFAGQLRLKAGKKAAPGLIELSKQVANSELQKNNQSNGGDVTFKSLLKDPISFFKTLFY